MRIIPVICYKVKNSNNVFLACYGYHDPEENKRYINVLNTDEEVKGMFCEKYGLDANNIEYFFHHEQEEFDTRGD